MLVQTQISEWRCRIRGLIAETSQTKGAKQSCDAGQHTEQVLLMYKLKLQVLLPKQ